MADQNPLLDDMAKLVTGAIGAAQSAGEEARTAMRSQADRMVASMDLASREEIEALKLLARKALDRVEELEARVDALERAKPKASTKSSGGKS